MRDLLLLLFERWGLPTAVRTDNGEPFGVPRRDVIPVLSLWLAAWGIKPILNRPRVPQDNAKVERNQGTVGRWLETWHCNDMDDLQSQLDEICRVQRSDYPVRKLGHSTRAETFKGLFETQRPFDPQVFDENKAHLLLQKAIYPRKGNINGAVSIYDKTFQVERKHRKTIVVLTFDPNTTAWKVQDQNGNLLKTIPDDRFSKEKLLDLTVFQ